MANFLQAADRIKQFAQDYKYMQEAADALASIGSLDQLLSERQAAVDAANVVLADLTDKTAQAKADLDSASASSTQLLADAQAAADKILQAAEHEAAVVARQANDDAKAVKEAAKAEAAVRGETTRTAMERANVVLDGVQAEVDAAEAKLNDLNDQIVKAESRLQAARDAAAKLINGE